MELHICKIAAAFLAFLSCLCSEFGAAVDTITPSQPIIDPQTIASAGNKFMLGFFSPVNSTNRYVGIWYSIDHSATKPVWVANRNKPINDSSGMLKISEDGNLVVLNGQKEILWSSNVSNGASNLSAQLTNDGNLVLLGTANRSIIVWQSFQQPSDTFLPGMKFISNARTGEKILLRSWISPSDPSIGSYSAGINPFYIPEFIVWKNNNVFWRSGPWNGQSFIGVPEMGSAYSYGYNVRDEGDGIFTLSSTSADNDSLVHFVLSVEGKFTQYGWGYGKGGWKVEWELALNNQCDLYDKCGPFGFCYARNLPICSCLRGFEPKNADEWNRGNWTSGCIRRTLLQCDTVYNVGEKGKGDAFLNLQMIKVPNFAEFLSNPSSEQECKDECTNNCSCVAYSYSSGYGCMSWTGNLMDIQKFSGGGTDINIRLAYSELDSKRNMKVIIIISVIVGATAISLCLFFAWRWMLKRNEKQGISEQILLSRRNESQATFSDHIPFKDNRNQVKLQELPLFSSGKLAAATNHFAIANKLGQGGFGQVYRGKLPGGQEIAVKRLSRSSGQGLEEFMNEVIVISKLQHRNLVRLLGCCVEGEEKMLVYEYMPNKSLDALLFDRVRKELLDWKIRFNIVEGICRGLLYLHRDSRLRIIHRDLKPSNILLDQELNPKISDFGMARIFDGNKDQADTSRIVGTYGYMSPEYVTEGRFSEKSDVFSFGVLLLEIVSGRRNTSFYGSEQALSLAGFAWKLWNEGNVAALIDPEISDPCFELEILRCVRVGLLCVQEFAKDRPNVPTVIAMLNSEILDLPAPKKPAFAERQIGLDRETFTQSQRRDSINNVTVSDLTGR